MSNGHCPSAMGKPQGNSISFFSIQKAKVLFPDYWIRHTHRHSLFLCMECVPMINENHVGKINVGFHFANFNFRFCVRKSLIKRTLTCSFSGFGQKFHTLDFKATYQILFALCWIHLVYTHKCTYLILWLNVRRIEIQTTSLNLAEKTRKNGANTSNSMMRVCSRKLI